MDHARTRHLDEGDVVVDRIGVDRVEVAQRLFDGYLKQIFEDGFFHADPHPGNLFVELAADAPVPGAPWTLTFVDFGMVGHVPAQIQAGLREAFLGTATRDARRVVDSFQALDMLLLLLDISLMLELLVLFPLS